MNAEPEKPPVASEEPAPHELPSTGRMTRALFWTVPTFATIALTDAAGTSRIGPPGFGSGVVLWLGLLGYMLPLFLTVGFLVAGLLALAGVVVEWAKRGGLPSFVDGSCREDALAATLPVFALFLMVVSSLHLSAVRFNNQQLAALLVALISIAALAVLGMVWTGAFAAARELRARLASRPRLASLLVWLAALVPILIVALWQARLNRAGFGILGPWMFAGPAGGVTVLLALWWCKHRFRAAARPFRLALWASLPTSTLLSAVLGYAWVELPHVAVQGGLWSSVVVRAARVATDVDRDGSSSLFGGGDCAPFDPTIHPLAIDIPGDGIDSNCLDGDALPFDAAQPPRWYDDAPGMGRSKNFVVVTVEALRSDRISFLGYKHRTTPNIDAFAKKSVIFPRMYAASSATTLSLASLFTTYVPSHTKTRPGKRHVGIDLSMPWIPEILREEGFRTGAVLVDYQAFKPEWNMGYDRGFEHYDTSTHIDMRGGMFYGFPSAGVIDKVTRFVDESAEKRFMVWTHLVEPHAAYEREPGAPNFGDHEEGLYASDLWSADRQIGRLLEHLGNRRLLEDTIVLITGDHGEAFGEHGEKYHYSSVHDPQLRTLGLLYVPGLGHRMVDQAVIHQDLTTTALNLLGVKRGFEKLRGRNVVPTFRGFRVEPDEIFPELAGFQVRVQSFALVRWPFKMIHPRGTKTYQLFHLEQDPGELTDVASTYPEQFAAMRERMARHVEAIGTNR